MTIAPTLQAGRPGPTATPPASATAHQRRITSIDTLRGLVMVIMLLDHVRETLYLHLQVGDPMAVPGTPPELFFSRLAAHFCAPVFVFLTGLSAWLHAHPPGGTPRPVTGYLLKRGLLLIALELTLVSFAWSGPPARDLPAGAVGHRLQHGGAGPGGGPAARAAGGGGGWCWWPGTTWWQTWWWPRTAPGNAPWTLLLHRGWLIAEGAVRVRLSYPALPWVGRDPAGLRAGAAVRLRGAVPGPALAAGRPRPGLPGHAVLLLRGLNLYGENQPWVHGETVLLTVMSWLNFTKYPPSLDFLLLTLGTGCCCSRRWRALTTG